MKVLKLLLLFAMGASLSLAGCDDDYLYPVEYPVYDPDGGSDNGELLPTLEEFIDVALHAGTTRLWLDVKRIEVGGATSNTAESVKACSRACEIIRVKKAQHFCEFIVSGNAAIWAGCYSAAQLAGIKVGWMSYSAPSAYKSYLDPWANLDYSNFFAGGAEVSNPKYPLQSYLDAGVALSVYNADTDPEMTYVLKYYPKLKAVCTNYPAKLLGRIGSEGL